MQNANTGLVPMGWEDLDVDVDEKELPGFAAMLSVAVDEEELPGKREKRMNMISESGVANWR